MIRHLKQELFQGFGTILSEKEQNKLRTNNHSVVLLPDSSSVYQTVADTWLTYESGVTILSVSTDNVNYEDYYLDKPVLLRSGIWITLTAFKDKSTVQISGSLLPRLVETKAVTSSFVVSPQMKIENLYTFFYHEKERGFLFSGEAHPMLELTYVDQGTLHSVVEGQDLVLEQGDMMLYGSNQWHMQYADMEVAPRYVSISFDAEGCDFSKLTNRKFRSPQKAIALLQQMLREQERMDIHSNDMIISLLMVLLITLLREVDAPGDRLQPMHCINNENEIISRAQQYISKYIREKLTVPMVAQNADVSTSYLTALFHKHLQISPGEYIRRIKLQESKQMIREGNMNFTEIATVLQYSTIHHFSRQFKEKFGITPTEYAKSVK